MTCTHKTPDLSKEEWDEIYKKTKELDRKGLLKTAPRLDIKTIGPMPLDGHKINCCGIDTAATKVTEIEVCNERHLRIEAICKCCERRVTTGKKKE